MIKEPIKVLFIVFIAKLLEDLVIMPISGLPLNYYKFINPVSGNIYDLANTCIRYVGCGYIKTSRFFYGDYKPIYYTPWNSTDSWTIASYVDNEHTRNFHDYFSGDPNIPSGQNGYGIVNGSKPQFHSDYYQLEGQPPGSGDTNLANYYLKIVPDSNKLSLYDFGYSNSAPNWSHSGKTPIKTFSVTQADGTKKAPERIMLIIQAGGGGGAGSDVAHNNSSGQGGSAGGFGIVIINTTITWYLRIGKAGWGGYGPGTGSDKPNSTYAYATCISDFADGETGSGSSYFYCGGGNPGLPGDGARAAGGKVSYQSKNDRLWALQAIDGADGGWYDYEIYAAGNWTARTCYCTNVSSDKYNDPNKLYFEAHSGGAVGSSGTSPLGEQGMGGGASAFGDGGHGGNYKESGQAAQGYGAGGGGAGWRYKRDGSNNSDGGNGGQAVVRIYYKSSDA